MKKTNVITRFLAIVFVSLTISSCKENKTERQIEMNHENHQVEKTENTTQKKKSLSPHTSAMAMVGDAHIHIDYSSPGVRGRIIFGGLVGYDSVWQAGAHMATWIETNKDLEIDGKLLPAGKYGFFTIPSKGDWTLMFNKKWEQHGKDEYDQKNDVLRFMVSPVLSESIQEHLEYKVIKTSETVGTLTFAWEKISIKIPFKVLN